MSCLLACFDGGEAIGFIKNYKRPRDADALAVLAQNTHADTVEGAHVGHKTAVIGVLAE